ncbi:ABC transporter, phosphonate, substrate-binding protein [Cribrihabitans marinus]|uniref:ABC transporter, phosphonate, substrate-binding protein n=2 Tax=Cribrihabitans marinus TaxID=1227549 RepID=A0A1H6THS3_9RHOB|nr:hypothetical protein GCM10010973_07420 [Cribrihabitans marinus]SEI75820.1 ABC transporter, phosphonate, substrate-binding protein [Cribrihabitans marinus]
MYDLPALSPAIDRYWAAIRHHLGEGPARLTRDADPWEVWTHPDLLLAQTCGFPYRARLHGKVALVGTPDPALPGCPPGHYCSVLVARADDYRSLQALLTGTFAFNEALSQSGWAAPMMHFASAGLRPAALVQTGAHAESARAVAEGRADLAGLDALTWELLQETGDTAARQLREVERTVPTPTLPYITAAHREPAPIAAAIRAAISDLSGADRAQLHLTGLVDLPAERYLAVPTPPSPSETLGQP